MSGALEIVKAEVIPTRTIPTITDEPLIWRYFVTPLRSVLSSMQLDEKEYIARCVMHINTRIEGAYVFSSGKNMGVFKAVGFPEDVGEFYRLEDYGAYSWTAHGRYPTNTPGWWGGAHPFALLDWTVVHNGETASVIAAPFWSTIARKPEEERQKLQYLRTVFPSLLITGPFSIVLGFTSGLMALNDRLKLRSMVTAEKGDRVYIASEEAAIRAMESAAENLYAPAGGESFIVRVRKGVEV